MRFGRGIRQHNMKIPLPAKVARKLALYSRLIAYRIVLQDMKQEIDAAILRDSESWVWINRVYHETQGIEDEAMIGMNRILTKRIKELEEKYSNE
jgi:hypothetical protein